MEIELTDNEFLRQFETAINDELAIIEYAPGERKIFLTKTSIPESVTDEDFQNQFIKAVLDLVDDRELKMMPTCPVIVKFVRKNKRYKNLLPVGVRI